MYLRFTPLLDLSIQEHCQLNDVYTNPWWVCFHCYAILYKGVSLELMGIVFGCSFITGTLLSLCIYYVYFQGRHVGEESAEELEREAIERIVSENRHEELDHNSEVRDPEREQLL